MKKIGAFVKEKFCLYHNTRLKLRQWETQLPSRTQRLWRWLKNPTVNSFLIAQSIAETWLANFRHKTIYLVIDRTDISDTHWLLFVGLAYRFNLSIGLASFARQGKLKLLATDRSAQDDYTFD